MLKKINKKYIFLFFVLTLTTGFIPFAYSKYIQGFRKHIVINAVQPTYIVKFDANGGTGTMSNQTFTYGTSQKLIANTFKKTDYTFSKWNTESDGSGDSYTDEESVKNLTENDQETIVLYAMWNEITDKIAKIGDVYYDTLQEAVNAVPNNQTETTIVLLNNTSEKITIPNNKNIILNLNDKTLKNDGATNVIKNSGILKITNGTITSSAAYGAVDNESTGNLTVDGARIIATGTRQAIYNNNGIVTIMGSTYLSASTSQRAALQNLSGGTVNILGGTIISNNYYGINNAGTMTIGQKDDNVDISSPVIQGKSYGLYTTSSVNFYDGVLKGVTNPINAVSNIADFEEGYGIVNDDETIDGNLYKVIYPGISNKVTFDGNGGTVSDDTKYVVNGKKLGTLPTAARSNHNFLGWYTASSGGSLINEDIIITEEVTFYAHWEKIVNVARIGDVYYDTVQAAITAASNNTLTTITLEKDINENLTIASNKNIVLDLNNKTIDNYNSNAVIENNGNVTVKNGTIKSNSEKTSALNNNAGKLIISDDAQIIATGSRQAVYVLGGVVEITGNAYLSSQTSGTPTASTMERGTAQCLENGTLIITGGTIEGLQQQAVSNEGTLIIGNKDGTIDATTPVLIGNAYGLKNTGTFNFYDGIIKGKSDAINGTVAEIEDNSQIINGEETISESTYKTAYLKINE